MSDGYRYGPDYRYACCEHCKHDDTEDYPADGHLVPCRAGCNDGEGAA